MQPSAEQVGETFYKFIKVQLWDSIPAIIATDLQYLLKELPGLKFPISNADINEQHHRNTTNHIQTLICLLKFYDRVALLSCTPPRNELPTKNCGSNGRRFRVPIIMRDNIQ